MKKKVEKLKRSMFVPLSPKAKSLFLGIEHLNLNTFMGQDLEWLKWPTFLGLSFAIVSFMIATLYLIKYTRGFFAKRKIPTSWKFILWGIFMTTLAEVGEIFAFYEWPMPGFFETNILLVLPHALGGVLIGLGAYFLYKETTS